MKKSIILISAFSVVAMMLASCESMLRSFDPFSPAETSESDETTVVPFTPAEASESDGTTVTHQTNRSTYELGRLGRTYDPQ